jgi:Ca-activated chloride channel homolog
LFQTAVLPNPLLVAIYPNDGTILADHPYAVLSWASPGKVAAASMFLARLLSSKSQQLFQNAGFRDSSGRAGSQISTTNRLNPDRPNYKALPAGGAIAAIQASWNTLRKPARLLIVVDVSASVGAGPLATIKKPLVDALAELALGDQVGLWQAPGSAQPVDVLVPVGALATTGPLIGPKVQAMTLVKQQAALVAVLRRSLSEIRSGYDANRIEAIVVLSPGTGATVDEVQQLLQDLRNEPQDRPIHIFTVAYGDHPDLTRLSQIALNSGAASYNTASLGSSFHDLMVQVLSNF